MTMHVLHHALIYFAYADILTRLKRFAMYLSCLFITMVTILLLLICLYISLTLWTAVSIDTAKFLDLSKKFDTLNRLIKIRKLRYYGVNDKTLDWFVIYFSQRKQFVNMLNVSSPTIFIDIVIGEGSCHGHLMLIIYMNDIVRCSIDIKFLLYAHDTTLYVSGVYIG